MSLTSTLLSYFFYLSNDPINKKSFLGKFRLEKLIAVS